MAFKLLAGTETTELQNLGGVEGSSSNNNLLSSLHKLLLSTDASIVAAVSFIQTLTSKVLDSHGLDSAIRALGCDHLGGKTVCAQGERVESRPIGGLSSKRFTDVVPRAASTALLIDMDRDLVDAGLLVLVKIRSVEVTFQTLNRILSVRKIDVFCKRHGVLHDIKDAWTVNKVRNVVPVGL